MTRSLSNVVVWLLLGLGLPVSASAEKFITYWALSENQLYIDEGGRANTIAVNPSNADEMFVASETGGLFRSPNGGHHWTHVGVDKLPVIFTQSVAYYPRHPEILLVSAKADFKAKNGGGVWRSEDGGDSWKQAELTVPNFTGRLSAYEISIGGEFGPIAVGTSQGVFLSYDRGLSWRYSDVFGSGDKTVVSVLAISGSPNRIHAAGPSGVRVATANPDPGPWTAPVNDPAAGSGIHDIHAFGRGLSQSQAFLVNDNGGLFRTQDGGSFWFWVPEAPAGGPGCGGSAFVEAVRRTSGINEFLDVYVGNRCGLHRLIARAIGESADFQHLIVQTASVDRAGTRDIEFLGREPVLLGTNSGLHNTGDHGLTWTIVGGGKLGGYNALQVTEVDGQIVGPPGNRAANLYVATQDNNLWATHVLGNVFRSFPGSAYFVEGARIVEPPDKPEITFAPGNYPVKLAGQNLLPVTDWHNPTGEAGKPAFIRPGQWVQQVRTTAAMQAGLATTKDSGGSWEQFAVYSEEPRDIPKLGRPGSFSPRRTSIVYQAYRSNGAGRPNRLMRIHRHLDSTENATVYYPAMHDFGGLGINPTMFAWYQVFGVDPGDSDHVIAPDVVNQQMLETRNGGEDWTLVHGLKDLVTKPGTPDELLFRTDLSGRGIGEVFPIVTAVSFCPDDPQLVLVGTSEGGIYFSNNNGVSWRKMDGSEKATYITSFFWRNANSIFVSTYGRGLWKLENVRIAVPSAFDELCVSCQVIAMDSGKAGPFDASVLTFRGRVLGVRTEKGQLREVFVTPGSSVVFTGDQNDPQQDIVITESEGRDTSSFEPMPKAPDGWILAGVVFTGDDKLTGAVFAPEEINLVPPASDKELKGSTVSPVTGRPYIRLSSADFNGVAAALPGEVLDLTASDFAAGARYEVLVDGTALKGDVTADGRGSFSTRIPAPPESGYHRVDVRMAGGEEVIDGSVFVVKPGN